MDRREFIKRAGALGAGFAIASLPLSAIEKVIPESDSTLKGVCDLHLHCAPDSKRRTIDELSMAKEAAHLGYRALMFKSNDFSCHDRAWLVGKIVPGLQCYGSIIMNRATGGINPYAVEKALATEGGTCRCVYVPTLDATYVGGKLSVFDTLGVPHPEVVKIMELCRDANIIFATGHSSPEESLMLAKKAKEVGVRKFVITHANSRVWKLTHSQIRKAVDMGAWIEYSCLPLYWGPGTSLPDYEAQSISEFIDFLNIAPERSFVSTDLGSIGLPTPIEGMKKTIRMLLNKGVDQSTIDLIFKQNPINLITQ